ncbi:MAG: Ig-like domain-containing protein [Candidatus Acidiferrum sp.]
MTWATNIPATSAIDYGTTSVYGASTPVNSSMVMTHQMNLTGLSQQTTYHFRVRSTNGSAAATSPDQTFSTMGSNSAPVVSVTSPASGATLSGKVNLTAVASDSGTLTGVQFRVDGGNVGPNLPAEPYLYVLDSSALNTGSHTISAVATDSSGNSTTSSAISVKVDNKTKDTTPPVVTLISPTGGAKVSGTVAVTAIASDNVSVASVQFQLDNANLGPAEAASPYLFSWDSTKTANGTHVLRAIATDSAGNSTTSATVSVTADNTSKDTTPPSVSITAPGNGAKVSGVVGVTANATDNVSVASVQFLLDGVNVGPVGLAAPFGYAWDTSKSTNGAHTLTAIATDGAGNAATSRAVTVRVNNPVSDTTPPAVAITSPVGAATVSGSVMIAANATDNVGVASVQFQVDGVNVGGLEGATPYAYTWDTTKVSNGPHRLDAIAKDTAGNTTVSSVVRVTVNNAAAQTFSISGILSGAGGSGATVTLSGTSGAIATANGAGAYTFTGLANGNYTVTPSHTGFTFSPASQAATINAANVTGINFAATAVAPQTFSISGTISGAGGSGATVILSGAASATTTTNGSGAYTFSGLNAGTYAATPSHSGFTFSPTTQSVTITAANVTGINFTATAVTNPTFSISGTITPSNGGSGATILLSGAAGATTTTSASGTYSFTGLANGNYTVTPNNSGFTFTPGTQSVTISGANKTGVNFTTASTNPASVTLSWNPSPSTVSGYNLYRSTVNGSGYVKMNSSLISGTSYDDTNVQSGTTYFYVATSVDSGGDESTNSNQASAIIP